MTYRTLVTVTALSCLLLVGCGGGGPSASGNNPSNTSSGIKRPDCPYSTAQSGTLCQVNFFECAGGNLSMYCTGSTCDCQKGTGAKTTFEDTTLCGLDGQARVDRAVQTCGW